jgi:Mce-associated membrane protein
VEVAVPPAPDGEAVGEPSDSTDTTSTDAAAEQTPGPRGPVWMLIGTFAVVLGCLLASVVALGRAGWSVDDLVDEQRNPQAQREQVMAVAGSFATQVATYGPDDLDEQNKMPEYAARIEKLLTPKFATSFEQIVPFAEQSVAEQGITRTADIYAVGVSELDDDSARVLVAGTNTFAAPNPKKPDEILPYDEQTFRFEVLLVRTQGKWLVDLYGAVGTLDESTGEQLEQLPTEAPSPGPTSPPSGTGQGGGDGQ